jgi:hypothetical protein
VNAVFRSGRGRAAGHRFGARTLAFHASEKNRLTSHQSPLTAHGRASGPAISADLRWMLAADEDRRILAHLVFGTSILQLLHPI